MSYYIVFIICLICIVTLNLFTKNTSNCNDSININKLIRQTSRWAIAAEQDNNPYVANLHATYALGYLMALREIYDDETIKNLTHIDIRKLDREVTRIMDDAVQKLLTVCPDAQPLNQYLALLIKQGKLKLI